MVMVTVDRLNSVAWTSTVLWLVPLPTVDTVIMRSTRYLVIPVILLWTMLYTRPAACTGIAITN